MAKFLNVGRVVVVRDRKIDWGLGYLINFHRRDKNSKKKGDDNDSGFYIADIMVNCKRDPNSDKFLPVPLNEAGEMLVLPFTLNCIYEITAIKISTMPSDLTV